LSVAVGAGLVTVAAPRAAMAECAAQLTAIMLRPCDNPADLSGILNDRRMNAVCMGPGLGVGSETRARVGAALASAGATEGATSRPVVLDADALTSFADAPDVLFAQITPQTVLTPHDGEFARLFPDIATAGHDTGVASPLQERANRVSMAAGRAGCTVLLKGAVSIIADPLGCTAFNMATATDRTPWLATAGSGDVLSGIIAGLMARGFDAFDAAVTGACLHTEAARRFGPGLIAEDLPEMLPHVFRDLGV